MESKLEQLIKEMTKCLDNEDFVGVKNAAVEAKELIAVLRANISEKKCHNKTSDDEFYY